MEVAIIKSADVINFKNPALKQLTDQQVRFAPPRAGSLRLHGRKSFSAKLTRPRNYPYQFVCYRLTDYRPTSYPDLVIDGLRCNTIFACL